MTALVTPFILVWIGVKVDMPIWYYIAVAVPLLGDMFIAGMKVKERE